MPTTSRWLYVCLGLTLVGLIATDCLFPKRNQKHLRFLYMSRKDANRITAPDKYQLQFYCSPGYIRIGPRGIACLDNEWSDALPTCERIHCPTPPIIENGKYKIDVFPVIGSSVFYICNVGYELKNDSESSLICAFDHTANSANWTGEIPTCKEKSICPDPGVSNDGDRKGSCCYSGDVLQFSCNDNHELVGSKAIECLSSGRWNTTRPLCKPAGIHCELPPVIPNGLVTGHKDGDYFSPYEEVEIICKPGYSYKGPAEYLLCEEDGKWEDEFGECEDIFCDPPGPFDNGSIPEVMATNLTSFPYGFEITYVCNKGFRLVGGESWSFCDKRGWSGQIRYCAEIHCPDPGVPEHGSREGHSFEVGAKVYFSCFVGYYLLGSFERYCMPNGQWTGELARCDTETNYCPDPGIPINGNKNGTHYDMGVRVGFRCRSGYVLVGSEVRECLQNRTWSGKEPRCLGLYDYDNEAHVRDILKTAMTKKAEEQEKKIQKYREWFDALWNNGPANKFLDIPYPGRIMLYFLFDASSSVGSDNFNKSVEFAKAVVKKIGISESGARAGAITFSRAPDIQFLPIDYKSTEETLNALDRIEYTGGGTSANSALRLVRTEFMPVADQHFGRKAIKTVLFILTDGRENMGGDPQGEAYILKNYGVEIYSIGITGSDLKQSLYKIASEPTDEHVFILENYSVLSWLGQEITKGTIDYSQCGLDLEHAGSHIHRGRILDEEQASQPWPWMVAIYTLPLGSIDSAEGTLQCGGSIIHERFILTAAHCMYGRDKATNRLVIRSTREVMVKLGLTNVDDETYVQEPEVLQIIVHPKYRPGPFFDYDIALLQLKTPIEFNEYVRPVCLPPAEMPEGTKLYKSPEFGLATGWGHDGTVGPNVDAPQKPVEHLKQLFLRIQSNETCIKSLRENNLNVAAFTDRMFCTGYEKAGNDTCRGDSGGLFMQSQLNPEGYRYWTQVGIISWGKGCGIAKTYGYYSHVQQLRLWVDSTIEDVLGDPKD